MVSGSLGLPSFTPSVCSHVDFLSSGAQGKARGKGPLTTEKLRISPSFALAAQLEFGSATFGPS